MRRCLPPSTDPVVRAKVKSDVVAYRARLAAAMASRRPGTPVVLRRRKPSRPVRPAEERAP